MKALSSSTKRFVATMWVSSTVLALTAFGRPPNEQVLTFLGSLLMAFLGISQWGQVQRAKAEKNVPPAA